MFAAAVLSRILKHYPNSMEEYIPKISDAEWQVPNGTIHGPRDKTKPGPLAWGDENCPPRITKSSKLGWPKRGPLCSLSLREGAFSVVGHRCGDAPNSRRRAKQGWRPPKCCRTRTSLRWFWREFGRHGSAAPTHTIQIRGRGNTMSLDQAVSADSVVHHKHQAQACGEAPQAAREARALPKKDQMVMQR